MPFWTVAEVAALSLGKDPHLLHEGSLVADEVLPTIKSFKEQYERIRRAVAIGLVGHDGMVNPQQLAGWLGDAVLREALTEPPRPQDVASVDRHGGCRGLRRACLRLRRTVAAGCAGRSAERRGGRGAPAFFHCPTFTGFATGILLKQGVARPRRGSSFQTLKLQTTGYTGGLMWR